MKQDRYKLTLDRPVSYQITVPGHLDESWAAWNGKMTITAAWDNDGTAVSILSCVLDQAALQGLLRRLYALGLPLISVKRVEPIQADDLKRSN